MPITKSRVPRRTRAATWVGREARVSGGSAACVAAEIPNRNTPERYLAFLLDTSEFCLQPKSKFAPPCCEHGVLMLAHWLQRALALVHRLRDIAAVKAVHECNPRCDLAVTRNAQF